MIFLHEFFLDSRLEPHEFKNHQSQLEKHKVTTSFQKGTSQHELQGLASVCSQDITHTGTNTSCRPAMDQRVGLPECSAT